MPRLCTESQAASQLGIELSVFRHWVACGKMPKPVEGTDKFDMKACHARLDIMSGIGSGETGAANALDSWRAKRPANAG